MNQPRTSALVILRGLSCTQVFFAACAILVLSLLISPIGFASSVADARKAFVQGELPTTIKMLEPELFPKPRLKGKQLEDAREIYGVTQFMLGNRNRAELVFKQIISANANAKLDKRYLLDPAVEPFFESLKKRQVSPTAGKQNRPQSANSARGRTQASTPAASARRANSRPTPPPEPSRQRPQAPQKRSVAAFTGVFVKVNAPRATIFADGIFIGAANQKISLEQGVHQLSVSAEGYETQEKQIRIQSGQVTNVTINLLKFGAAKPKATQASKPKSKPVRQGSASAESQSRASINFNQELPAEKKVSRARKNFTDKYFQEPAQQFQQPPQQYSPPPQYSPPQQYAPPPQPYQPVPQQPYAQPYGYPPPVYSAPPVYQAPQPYGYPDPYAQPPPAYSAPPAPAYGAPDPYEEENEAGDVARAEPRFAGSRGSRNRNSGGGNAFLAAMPLGIGQFQNGHNIKGTLFLLAQGGALGFGLTYKLYNIPKDKKLFDAQRAEEADLTQEERDAIETLREAHLKKLTNYSNYALMAAGGLYAIGVIDAFIYLDSNSGSPKRKRSFKTLVMPQEPKYKVAMGTTSQGGLALGLRIRLD